jgi:hypothetical protein
MTTSAISPERAKIGSSYVNIFYPGTTYLMFRYDPVREIIELQNRGIRYYVDLAEQKVTQAPRAPEQTP